MNKKYNFLFFMALMLLPAMQGCSDSKPEPQAEVKGQELLVVTLPGSAPEANLVWQFEVSKAGLIEETEPALEHLIPGNMTYAFVGKAPGEAEIAFTQIRQDQPEVFGKSFANYHIKVLPDKSISVISFYQEYDPGEAPGSSAVSISLPVQPGKEWSYQASEDGIITEGSIEEVVFRPEDVGADMKNFVFKGVAPGQVELNFVYGKPGEAQTEDSARFKLHVFEDNTLYIIGSNRHQY